MIGEIWTSNGLMLKWSITSNQMKIKINMVLKIIAPYISYVRLGAFNILKQIRLVSFVLLDYNEDT